MLLVQLRIAYMRYSVKTYYGITQDTYSGTVFEPLFGTGQGSGASPSAWLSLVVVIMNTIDKVIKDRMEFTSIDGTLQHSRLIDAYVDDTALGITSAEDTCDYDSLVEKLEHAAQTWEQLLLLWWRFKSPQMLLEHHILGMDQWNTSGKGSRRHNTATQSTQAGSTARTTIRHNSMTAANRILGVHIAPNGDFSKQLQIYEG
jgi:hypothetical protein